MLIFRYLFKQTIKTQFAVMLVLMLIFISQKFVRILGDAADGHIPGAFVAKLLLLNIPNLAILILPISFFIGVLFAHGRLYADSEMSVLFACGYSPNKILGITAAVGAVTFILAGANTLFLTPYVNSIEQQVMANVKADSGISSITPGRFVELSNQAVAFVENITNNGKNMEKVFVAHNPPADKGQPSIVMAARGNLKERPNGSQWLDLSDGTRYEGNLNDLDYKVMRFDRYSVRLQERSAKEQREKIRAMPTAKLFGSDNPDKIAELQWRIAMPVSVIILVLMVVPLGVINPRQGRYAKLFPAIMLYLSYYLLMSAARSSLEDGRIPWYLGMWLVHLLMLVIAGSFLFVRSEKFLTVKAVLKGERRVSNH
ncbi:LPS export ABC transporter permease LptF [Celerinatantimonas diazotrophica]|uniref:Lipopolysaccharide export system permease protein LptF n=1 Tax=Celerinatantimonas diazotrophica TaxID=412034 RepID=A0A4R1J994_9GAMM|nr:LPS export ABC transporter permease LptF [Celerinatantimonas diazotrophica]TCK46974.1 lipopolysaccharide export system permease protein [Celerinatantimonas diazotrophica]